MKNFAMSGRRAAVAGLFTALLASGCGGGGGNPGACVSGSCGSSPAAAGFPATTSSAQSANICTLEGQKTFTRAYLNENYLWYSEIPAVDPSLFTSVVSYFYALRTLALDATGQRKDRFSFITSAVSADSLTTGAAIGYGLTLDTDAQNRQRVAFVDAGSPAAAAGLARGGEVVRILTPGSPSLYPNAVATISFEYRPRPGAAVTTVNLTSAPLQEDPLPLTSTLVSSSGRRVGYLLFNAHTQGAQDRLVAAVRNLQAGGAVQDLVLDLRYNGGGYLYTALALSSMLTGTTADGQVFEQLRFNDKRAAETAAATILFSGLAQVGEPGSPVGSALPRLNLPRVYVLTSDGTCSASESVINSLRGVDVQVVLIGKTTCGKPYGFSRKDNCGLSYFPIEVQGVNAKGFGDYAAGFAPTCDATDDFDNALGAPAERLLATALSHIDSGICPVLASAPLKGLPASATAGVNRMPVRGKLLTPPHATPP